MESDLFRQIVESAADPIIVADRDGAIRVWNGAAQRLFGHSAQEAIGQSLDLIIPERFRDQHWTGFDRVLAAGETKYATDLLLTRSVDSKGNTLYVEMTLAVLKGEDGGVHHIMAVLRDVSARQQEQRQLRQRLAELEKQVKAAAP